MWTVLAALQMEYGAIRGEELEPLMAGLAAGTKRPWDSCTAAPGRRCTAWPCPSSATATTPRT